MFGRFDGILELLQSVLVALVLVKDLLRVLDGILMLEGRVIVPAFNTYVACCASGRHYESFRGCFGMIFFGV